MMTQESVACDGGSSWTRNDSWIVAGLTISSLAYAFLTVNWAAPPSEDAAMLLKYAANLAAGHGIVWNIGEPPVDGPTDFLPMVLVAGLAWLGVSVEHAVRALGLASHVGTVILIYATTRLFCGNRFFAAVSAAFLAVGPGLRYVDAHFCTPIFAFMAAVSWAFILALRSSPESRRYGVGYAVASLTMGLIRPEGVLFAVFMLGGLVASRGLRRCLVPIAYFTVVFGVLGGGYFLWRWHYFGYPLPNPFYVKGGGNLYIWHLQLAIRSVIEMAFPFTVVYLAAAALMVATLLRGRRHDASRPLWWIGCLLLLITVLGLFRTSKDPYEWLVFGRYSPRYASWLLGLAMTGFAVLAAASRLPGFVDGLLAKRPAGVNWLIGRGSHITLVAIPAVGFTLMWVLLSGEMNYFSRFQYAVLPVILMSWPLVTGELLGDGWGGVRVGERGVWALLLASAAFVLLGFQHTRYRAIQAGADGKYAVAMMLRDYRDRGYLLATSEAGLLPLYSGWRAMDTWGLNDSWIAHNGGITKDYLIRNRPQVIVFYGGSPFDPTKPPDSQWQRMVTTVERFAREEGYELAAVFGEKPTDTHHYYVARDIPESEEIVRRIRGLTYRWYETGAVCVNYALLQPVAPTAADAAR